MTEKISCAICCAKEHSIQHHLKKAHLDITLEQYIADYPNAPLMSEAAKEALEKRRRESAGTVVGMAGTAASVTALVPKGRAIKKFLHDIFDLGKVKAALSMRGEAISISVMSEHDQQEMVPVVSDHYVYNIDELKDVVLAMETKIPCYIWGHKGSGKSELLEQVCARTNRPMIRVQHTVNTEESHIVGQWTVKGGQTEFELGPLPMAMINGWTFIADEYDFGLPSVLAVYQAVLEGKALTIKEAPAHLRIIKPHLMFQFCATGNTNGGGDETGLYQGTMIQNSANYDRFGMVINKKYMDKKAESQILQNHCNMAKEDADKMVEFATLVRQAYDGAKISDTISPRTLIYASKIGIMRGSYRHGLTSSFGNKLNRVDKEVCDGLAQRVFG